MEFFVEKGFGDEYEAIDFGLTGGTSWDSGSAYILYNYSEHDDVFGADRGYVSQDHTARGGSDFRSTSCSPGTVVAMNIPFALPTLTPGANFCDETDVLTIYPEETNHRVFGKLMQDLSPDLSPVITLTGKPFIRVKARAPEPACADQAQLQPQTHTSNPFWVRPHRRSPSPTQKCLVPHLKAPPNFQPG